MSQFEMQKAKKLTIEDVAREQLDGDFWGEFEQFLAYLKQNKISIHWKSINGFNMKYRGDKVGIISFLGAGSWDDGIIEAKNHVHIGVDTVGWGKSGFDTYLENQSDEIVDLLMEMIANKCIHCRPTCGCSQASGRTVEVAGNSHQNACMNATQYAFKGDNMRELTMFSPRASITPVPIRHVPIDTVKKLIHARKEYIEKMRRM